MQNGAAAAVGVPVLPLLLKHMEPDLSLATGLKRVEWRGREIVPLLALRSRDGVPLLRWLWASGGYDDSLLDRSLRGTFHLRAWREDGLFVRTLAITSLDGNIPLPLLGITGEGKVFLFQWDFSQEKSRVTAHPVPLDGGVDAGRIEQAIQQSCDCERVSEADLQAFRPPDGIDWEGQVGEAVPPAVAEAVALLLEKPLCCGYVLRLSRPEEVFLHSVLPLFAPPTAPHPPGERVAVSGKEEWWFCNVVSRGVWRMYGGFCDVFSLEGKGTEGLRPCGDSVEKPVRFFGRRENGGRDLPDPVVVGSPGGLFETPDGLVWMFLAPAYYAPEWRLVKAVAVEAAREFASQVEVKEAVLPMGLTGVMYMVGRPRRGVRVTLPVTAPSGGLEGLKVLRPVEVDWLHFVERR